MRGLVITFALVLLAEYLTAETVQYIVGNFIAGLFQSVADALHSVNG